MDYCCISELLPTVILASLYKESEMELQALHARLLNSLLVPWWVLLRISCISYFSLHVLRKRMSLHPFELMDARNVLLQEAPFQVFVAFPELQTNRAFLSCPSVGFSHSG